MNKNLELIKSGKHNIRGASNYHFTHNQKFIRRNYARFFQNKDLSILELGFGSNGNLLRYLQDSGYKDITGVDLDKDCIQSVADMNDITIVQNEIASFLNENTKKFDVIVMKHVLEHMPKDQCYALVEKMHDTLNEGGFCLIEVPNVLNSMGLKKYMSDLTHNTPFCSESLKQLFSSYSKCEVLPIKYPMINTTSFKTLMGSTIFFVFACLENVKSFVQMRFGGDNGPFSINILGVFYK